ncbi:carboxypeptidase-like regulatory domain-containing protein [Winogradskyella forsetii]|uniref:carboxypeptidase-like regulatory domain-containing protein n=2 Tax=Winogradskyella forsetii TaxID=2686077 RepID=UPI0015B8910B|nr:carboxypeptidase-like regulatory domain-containing protein [Winogradskyella forsetii]
MLVLAKPKLVAYLLASDFPSENPRTQTRNFPYTKRWHSFMKIRTIILTLGILIGLISCAKKNYVVCGLGSDMNLITLESKIIELKRIGIADTTLASISGKIYAKSINKNDTLTDNFAFTNIWVRDLKTDSLIGTTSDSKGEFQFTIPASEYDLQVQFIGFNNLKVKNVKVGTGDIISFSAILGQGNGTTEYKWNQAEFYNNTNK